MQRILVALLMSAALVAGNLTNVAWSPAWAQGALPDLGDVIVEDSLSETGVTAIYTCATGRIRREFANDGLTISATGGCQVPEGYAGSGIDAGSRLKLADGEIQVEFRPIAVQERTQVVVQVRTSSTPQGFSGYSANFNLARGSVQLGVSVDGQFRQFAQRNDLSAVMRPTEWNTLALRAHGPNFWVSVNGTVVLAATDSTLEEGNANSQIYRAGPSNADDMQEIVGVLRNLKVSALADGVQARRPTYMAPPPVVTVSELPCTQPTAVANDVRMNLPGGDVDPAIAKLAGAWEGVWEPDLPGRLPSRLYVEQFDGTKVTVVYTWGDQPAFNGRAGWSRIAADVTPDGKITWGTARKFTFWAVDDTVEGTLETAQFASKVTYARCP